MGLSSQLASSSLARPGVCTSSTRPASPYNGQLIYETDTRKVYIHNGTSWVEQPTAGMVDAKGDLLVGTAADTAARLAAGSNNTVLVADSAATAGVKWADLSGISQPWTNFVPSWTGSVTNPSIGNGAIISRYIRIGNTVIMQGWILCGSTTTYGSGALFLSLPIEANLSITRCESFGQLLDASAGYPQYFGGGIFNNAFRIEWRLGNAAQVWQPTVPITMADGDQFRFTIIYEAA